MIVSSIAILLYKTPGAVDRASGICEGRIGRLVRYAGVVRADSLHLLTYRNQQYLFKAAE